MAGLVPPAASMDEWIRTLMRVRREGPKDPAGDEEIATMTRAVNQMRATGTVLVGDISNTLTSVPVLQSQACDAVVFHEILGFNPVDPVEMVQAAWQRERPLGSSEIVFAVVAHAPYSTAPALFAEIAARHQGPAPLSVHVAESLEEIEFLRKGRGPIREMLRLWGSGTVLGRLPGAVPSRPQTPWLPSGGDPLVHCVHLTLAELDEVRDADTVIVTCPRSNLWVGGECRPYRGSTAPVFRWQSAWTVWRPPTP